MSAPDHRTNPLGSYPIADQLDLVRAREVAIAIARAGRRFCPVVYTDLRHYIKPAKQGGMTKAQIETAISTLAKRRLLTFLLHTTRAGKVADAIEPDFDNLGRFIVGFRFDPTTEICDLLPFVPDRLHKD